MWVQYKQGEVITPQRQNAPQTQSLRYHTADVPFPNENRQTTPSEALAGTKTSVNSSVFKSGSHGLYSEKQNHFTEKTPLKPRFLNPALLFTDELQAINCTTNAQDAQSIPDKRYHTQNHITPKHERALSMFVCLYLLGAAFAGVLYATLSSSQTEYLSYYVSHFIESIGNVSAMAYWANLCSICAVSLTAVVLLGLSALGLPLLFVLLFLKGIWCGVLLLQFFAQYQWNGLFYYYASVGIIEVCLVTGLCLLACTAAKSASVLFQTALNLPKEKTACKTRQLVGQYLALLFFLLMICLLSTVIFRVLLGNFQLG